MSEHTPLQLSEDIAARLTEQRLRHGWKLTIGSVADLAAAQRDDSNRDRCYVVLLDTTAKDNAVIGMVEQTLTHGIGIIIAARNHRGRGEAALNDIEPIRQNIALALVGWCPPRGISQTTYRRGQLLSFEQATIWWQDEYKVDTRLTQSQG